MQGLPVFPDANIPITLAAGTNQDLIIVSPFSDDLLFEDPVPTVAVYEGVLSASLQVRILCYEYVAFTFARYAKANSIISGTGLTTDDLSVGILLGITVPHGGFSLALPVAVGA